MGKAPEAADDLAMLTSVGEEGLAESVVQRYRAILVGKVLGMGERQVEEQPQRVPDLAVEALSQSPPAQRRAWASLAYMRGVPRKALRGYWSSSNSRPRWSSASSAAGRSASAQASS